MNYEPQRIQSEGRPIEVGEKANSSKVEPGKGQTQKTVRITEGIWHRWIIAEYKRELKAYPDWRREARRGLDQIKAREKYSALTAEEKKEKRAREKAMQTPEAKEQRNKWFRDYSKQRIAGNPSLRVMQAVRARFKKILNGKRLGSARELLGCSGDDLRHHLERQFKRGMSWANYGSHWHIDHIIPCSSFDHTNPKQRAQCWHWTNLRPLDAAKNMAKSDTITEPQMSLLMNT